MLARGRDNQLCKIFCICMHDLFVIPFKTTNSSTNERLIAIVIEYLCTPTVIE